MTTRRDGGNSWSTKLQRVRSLSQRDTSVVFNNLGHIIDLEMLRYCYQQLDGKKAAGVDGVTKKSYGDNLGPNLESLLVKIRRGTYQPKASRIVEIPKEDGSRRPLAISCLEDKIVQSALNMVLQAIYEPVFLPCSYGFRPETGTKKALTDLIKLMHNTPNGAVIEIDIRKYFNSVPHKSLMKLLETKINDRRLLGLLQKLMIAPTLDESGKPQLNKLGVPQGSIVSPILANIYLHHVIDLWVKELSTFFNGGIHVIRYADDMVFVLRNRSDAERLYRTIPKRLAKYGLEMSMEKSSIVPCGTWVISDILAQDRPMPKFKFLGFEVMWSEMPKRDKRGRRCYRPRVKPRRDRMNQRLREIRNFLKENLNATNHMSVVRKVKQVVHGWSNYFAVSDCDSHIWNFCNKARRLVFRWFNRRGKRGCACWQKVQRILESVKFEVYIPLTPLYPQTAKRG